MALTYFDFDLEIERTEQGYRLDVQKSLAGEPLVNVSFTEVDLDIEGFLTSIGRSHRSISRSLRPAQPQSRDLAQALRTFGQQMYQTFFPGQIGTSYRRSLDAVESDDWPSAGLRIRLRLTGSPELAELPWEYLYDPVEDDFVTRSAKTPLIRYPEVPQLIRPFSVRPPLSVLVIISSPTDVLRLDVQREWQLLSQALSDLEQQGRVTLELLDRATVPQLQEYLSRDDYNILHFIGHGDFDRSQDTGVFLMERDDRQSHPVSTEDLRTLLRDKRERLRLVILNACKGARSSAGDPFSGLAQGLIRAGIQAVIGMQFAITDEAAIDFAQGFYQRVAGGFAIDRALGEVRKAMSLKGHKLEWGTPVLFMRSLDGKIFDVHTQGEPASARRARTLPLDHLTLDGQPAASAAQTTTYKQVNRKVLKWFVNRERQRKAFLAMLEQQVQKQIMLVEAPTHMGKTWLINWLLGKCHADKVPVAHFDFDLLARRPLDYLTVIRYARDQLGARHFGEMTELIARAGGDDLGNLAMGSDAVRNELKRGIVDTFLRCLGKQSHGDVVAVLIDAYENAKGEALEWIEELLFWIRLDRLPSVLVVIAGQKVPSLDEDDYGAFLIPADLSNLEPFDLKDVTEYLSRRGFAHLDPEEIHRKAHGLPRQISNAVEEALLGV